MPPGGAPDTPPPGEHAKPKKQRTGLLIGTTAVIAAVLASLATAGLTGAFSSNTSDGSSSYSQLGSGDGSGDIPVKTDGKTPDWTAVASAVQDSVVAIQVTSGTSGDEGSGVIMDKDGHVLTNNHVVADGQTIQVVMDNGTIYSAKIVGTDPTTDLAVIQMENPPSDLKPATFGDSSKVAVGEPVMAVGNPLGLDNTATTGIVSAVNRPVSTTEEGSDADPNSQVVTNAIQVDAAINPGNSGGPLFNDQGEVIGINSSIASLSSSFSQQQSGSIGLGFAIPINQAKNIAGQLIDNGTAQHAYLGVSMTDGTAEVDGTTRTGAKVASVVTGSPADKAGIQAGDVIVGIDGQSVGGADSLTAYVRSYSVGDEVTLNVVRDGKALDVKVTLGKSDS